MTETPGARILIVDDEAAHTMALCNTLREEGYTPVGFNSAKDALATLHKESFDLLLTDLMMPEMDGITFLRAALETDANLVSIMMTGHGTIDSAVKAMKSGALDYILKPFKLTAILPVLARALVVRRLHMENAQLTRDLRARTIELEAANKELDAFAYSVSHDLRAPLRSIGGFSQMILKDRSNLSERHQHWLERVCESTEEMGGLIEGLLALSRLGRQPLSKRSVDVAELVRSVAAEQQKDCASRQVEVRIGELPDCHGDPLLLRQVFVNLLSNAFKYTCHRERAVIEIGCQQQGGEQVYSVRDDGAGFDMKYAGKLFGAFQRLHSREEFEGTGVGLSVVQRIIARHGGRVWAEARLNKGATFYFSLPDSSKS